MDPISQEIAPPKASPTDLDTSLVHGVAWIGAVKWSTQALTWLATLLIARILSPSDYGVFSMALLYLGLLSLVTEFGLGTAVITLRDLSQKQIAQLNSLSVLLGCVALLLTAVAAVPLGHFFRSPELPTVLMVMAVGFVISSFQSIPNALLQRDLRFRTISTIELAKSISMSVVMLVLAFMGARYWTLVAGSLVGAFFATFLTLVNRRVGLAWPDGDLSHAMKYSWQVLMARVGWYSYGNSDFLVAGRVLGAVPLGYYTLAWDLATLPIDKTTTMVGTVTPGIYSAAQEDVGALRRYLLKPTEVLSIILFPVMIGLALVAKDAVLVLLGAKWENAILPLQFLSLYACIRFIMPLFGQILLVTGDSRFVMWTNVLCAIGFPLAFLVGSRWGAVGIAATWVIIYPFNAIPLYRRVLKRIHMSHAEFFRALWPGIHGTLIMATGVLAFKLFAGRIAHPIVSLALQVFVGGALYCAVLWIWHRKHLTGFAKAWALLRR